MIRNNILYDSILSTTLDHITQHLNKIVIGDSDLGKSAYARVYTYLATGYFFGGKPNEDGIIYDDLSSSTVIDEERIDVELTGYFLVVSKESKLLSKKTLVKKIEEDEREDIVSFIKQDIKRTHRNNIRKSTNDNSYTRYLLKDIQVKSHYKIARVSKDIMNRNAQGRNLDILFKRD